MTKMKLHRTRMPRKSPRMFQLKLRRMHLQLKSLSNLTQIRLLRKILDLLLLMK